MVVGDGSKATFHHNRTVMTGSLFPPNMDLISRFVGLSELLEPAGANEVQTHRLDDLIELESIDFLKMDVQGGELAVLDGAPRLVTSALIVRTEVEFVPIYIDQPLFADIDTRMRTLGFQFHSFSEFGSCSFHPLKVTGDNINGFNQMLWSDAVYIPDLSKLEQYTDENLLKLVTI